MPFNKPKKIQKNILLNKKITAPSKMVPKSTIQAKEKSKILIPVGSYENKKIHEKNTVTVIIPTLQMVWNDITKKIVRRISEECESLKEILIINNANHDMMTTDVSDLKNVKIINDKPNLYVNSAWNYGIQLTDTEFYCLLNDDIVFKPKLLDAICNFLTENKQYNITTVATANEWNVEHMFSRLESESPYNPNLTFDIRKYPQSIKQGWFLFGRKSLWVPIRLEITGHIMNGDDWILQRNMEKCGSVVLVTNNKLFHAESSTVIPADRRKEFIQSISKPPAEDYSIYQK